MGRAEVTSGGCSSAENVLIDSRQGDGRAWSRTSKGLLSPRPVRSINSNSCAANAARWSPPPRHVIIQPYVCEQLFPLRSCPVSLVLLSFLQTFVPGVDGDFLPPALTFYLFSSRNLRCRSPTLTILFSEVEYLCRPTLHT
ncbi:hypothetical protein PENSPDRAFT_383752 [Peniophora sp. CONT]|nr:hypothetical protein PENSPDRAFT_383752 [Peniophora sp. CONT]